MFTPSLCLGLLEIAKQQLTQGVSGKPNYVWDEVTGKPLLGHYGWNANQPNLRQQIVTAVLNDIARSLTQLASQQMMACGAISTRAFRHR